MATTPAVPHGARTACTLPSSSMRSRSAGLMYTRADPATCQQAAGLRTDLSSWRKGHVGAISGHYLPLVRCTGPSCLEEPSGLQTTASEIFGSPRAPLRGRPRVDPASQPDCAGARSGMTVRQQNHHYSSDAGPCRAPSRHFELQRKARGSSCPPRTDPITFRHLDNSDEPVRSLRRVGYGSPCAVGTWSLAASAAVSPLGCALLPEPEVRKALRLGVRVHTSPRGELRCHVAGGEDLLPAGTRRFLPCEHPPSPVSRRHNDLRSLSGFERAAQDQAAAAAGMLGTTPLLRRRPNPQLQESAELRLCLRPDAADMQRSRRHSAGSSGASWAGAMAGSDGVAKAGVAGPASMASSACDGEHAGDPGSEVVASTPTQTRGTRSRWDLRGEAVPAAGTDLRLPERESEAYTPEDERHGGGSVAEGNGGGEGLRESWGSTFAAGPGSSGRARPLRLFRDPLRGNGFPGAESIEHISSFAVTGESRGETAIPAVLLNGSPSSDFELHTSKPANSQVPQTPLQRSEAVPVPDPCVGGDVRVQDRLAGGGVSSRFSMVCSR